jgi:sialic acid synthase SpsE
MKAQVIAEPAIYWHGDVNILYTMVDVAAMAQCEYFKYQMFDTKYLTGKFKAKEAFYKSCQLDTSDLNGLKQRVEKSGMKFLVTVMTPNSLEVLTELKVNSVKIASGQISPKLIDAFNQYDWDEVFVSTGMLDDGGKLDMLGEIECDRVNVLHCVSLYPQYDSEGNMSRINTLKELLGDKFHYGYSDHSLDDLACMHAASIGAEYIERHFMLDAGCYGPTSQVCCTPQELSNLNAMLRRLSVVKGDGRLLMQEREKESYNHYKNRFMF